MALGKIRGVFRTFVLALGLVGAIPSRRGANLPKGPRHAKTVCVVNLLTALNLLCVAIHYGKCSESLHVQ